MLSPSFSFASPTTPKFTHEETVIYLKKNISTVERNSGLLEKAFDNYSKNQTGSARLNSVVQSKSMKIGTILEIIAEDEIEASKTPLLKLAKLIQQKEILRGELAQRIDAACVEPLSAYPILCGKLMNDIKAQKNAIQLQKKKRQQTDQLMLKESGEMGRPNSARISKSQMELAEATGMITATTDSLQEALGRFEIQKEEDLKKVLEEYVYSEINFHAKYTTLNNYRALELLTEAAAVCATIP